MQLSDRKALVAVLAGALAGLPGLTVVGSVLLWMAPEPTSAGGHAWRRFGIVALGAGWVGALVGGVAGLWVGMGYPPTAAFAAIEGGVLGFVAAGLVGVVVGALAGGADYCSRTRRA